jgi:hypothetical protein
VPGASLVRYASRVIRHALLLAAASLSLLAREPGCGGVDSSSSGVNAPCTRDYDCASGLTCQQGVCTGPAVDAGTDGGAKDAAGDG